MSVPRYLAHLNLRRVPAYTPDVLVIGGGVAGLAAAMKASRRCHVMVVTKWSKSESNTFYAQGGIAAALDPADSPDSHLADTLAAGAGLCDEAAARKLVYEGVDRVRDLMEWGTRFDRTDGDRIALTSEGGHSARRILHADGDATGREIERSLLAAVESCENVDVLENHCVMDLLHDEGGVYGALMLDPARGGFLRILAAATVLATGGAGQLYRETTNPGVATGDGLAMALRAGAELADMEFIQFHPTTLYVAGAPRFLISEALRGEGAQLRASDGRRFMTDVHERAELAPRDVVSVSIVEEMRRTGTPYVFLDLRHLDPDKVEKRFPNIASTCARYGIDLARDMIPVRPSAHYVMGGVRTDLQARTRVPRLLAAGECACTGVHGANRLASNSLLEGLVFGTEAGASATEIATQGPPRFTQSWIGGERRPANSAINVADVTQSLKSLMWNDAGVFRCAEDLDRAAAALDGWRRYVLGSAFDSLRGIELQNMILSAGLIIRAARLREESRGAHRRTDFPDIDDDHWNRRVNQTIADFDGDG